MSLWILFEVKEIAGGPVNFQCFYPYSEIMMIILMDYNEQMNASTFYS